MFPEKNLKTNYLDIFREIFPKFVHKDFRTVGLNFQSGSRTPPPFLHGDKGSMELSGDNHEQHERCDKA